MSIEINTLTCLLTILYQTQALSSEQKPVLLQILGGGGGGAQISKFLSFQILKTSYAP